MQCAAENASEQSGHHTAIAINTRPNCSQSDTPCSLARLRSRYCGAAFVTALIGYSNTGLLGSTNAQKIGSTHALVAWMLVEARLLQRLGTTPDKLPTNVRIRRRDVGAIGPLRALAAIAVVFSTFAMSVVVKIGAWQAADWEGGPNRWISA